MSALLFKKVQVDALFEAICEDGLTPYFVVAAEHPLVVVPESYVQEGMITLNLSGSAVKDFTYDDEGFMYTASFGGQVQTVIVPYGSIGAVFPKENPKVGSQYPVIFPTEPVAKKKPQLVSDEAEAFGGVNPDAHVGWEKSAVIV